ncbi:hypothetical protein Tco_1131463, partial [Tanacetum coccineum]
MTLVPVETQTTQAPPDENQQNNPTVVKSTLRSSSQLAPNEVNQKPPIELSTSSERDREESPGGTSAPSGQTQGGPSPAFMKENIDVLRTMIKDLDNKGQEKVTPRKLFNEESGGAGSENSQMSPSAKEVEGYSSNRSSRSRSQGRPRSAWKHRKSVSRKKGTSKSHRSVRSEARSRSKSKSVKSKPQLVRASRRKSSSDSGYDTMSDSGLEDLSMPY